MNIWLFHRKTPRDDGMMEVDDIDGWGVIFASYRETIRFFYWDA